MGNPSAVLSGSAEVISETPHGRAGFLKLAVGCIGVAYGDIGTSPLYAFREAVMAGIGDGEVTRATVLGVVSLILWALILIVTVKYVLLLLNADNEGEGGTLSLMALALRAVGGKSRLILGFGLTGAALFYGDAIITPAISVLSAVEGLELVTPAFAGSVVPVTVAILVALFAVQSRGTRRVAAWFGPIMMAWFAVMGIGGLFHIQDDPGVLGAFNPLHALRFIATNGTVSFLALGAVFLAVTGAEALYADLGHFGRRSIQTAWLVIVFPALALNYLGQGALVLSHQEALANPFFLLFPGWALLPIVLLATIATVIASQAVITGAFSLSRQAIQLGLLPRLEVRHTSQHHAGQIFIPQVNLLLLLGVLLLVALFTNSSDLAAAYGVAVTGEMVMTALMAFTVIRRLWRWPFWLAAGLIAPLLALDTVFLTANLMKTMNGGYVPLMFAGMVMTLMITWRRGTRLLFKKTRRTEVPLVDLVRSLEKRPPHRVPGTAVFLTSDPESAPTALMHNLKHNKVLHEQNVVLSVRFADLPHVAPSDRVAMQRLGDAFARVTMSFGYMENPNVPKALAIARRQGWTFDIMSTSFFLSRRKLRPSPNSGMPLWQDRLFIMLARNADDASDYFHIPTGRVVEVGTQMVV